MSPNLQETVDLVTFTEEIVNGKFHFLCGVSIFQDSRSQWSAARYVD